MHNWFEAETTNDSTVKAICDRPFKSLMHIAEPICRLFRYILNSMRRWMKRMFRPKKLTCIDRLIRNIIFFELRSELTRQLTCKYRVYENKKMNLRYLVVKPHIITKSTKHIVLFKSHATSIFSFVQNFGIDHLTARHNIVCYLIDYHKTSYDINVRLGRRKSTHCTDHLVMCIDHLVQRICRDGHTPILVGFSLGCAVLLEYASRISHHHFSKIILLSPFLSLKDFLADNKLILFFFGKNIERHFAFNNRMNIIRLPNIRVLILHGRNDRVIPVAHAKELARLGRCRFVEVPWCKHVDIVNDRYVWLCIRRFINDEK